MRSTKKYFFLDFYYKKNIQKHKEAKNKKSKKSNYYLHAKTNYSVSHSHAIWIISFVWLRRSEFL